MALVLARALAQRRSYDAEATAEAYGRWFASAPPDCGEACASAFKAAAWATTGKAAAARAAADRGSQLNGSLMRVAPVGVWAASPGAAAAAAMEDSALSHPHPICAAACGAYAAAIAAGIGGADRTDMLRTARVAASAAGVAGLPVVTSLDMAADGVPPKDFQTEKRWALIALQNAFFHLAATPDPAEALIRTISCGGDTDTNAAVTGALLGAAAGRAGWPGAWTLPVLTCRPGAVAGDTQPRPEEYWPDDIIDLAEVLLLQRRT